MDWRAGQATVLGFAKSWTWLSTNTHYLAALMLDAEAESWWRNDPCLQGAAVSFCWRAGRDGKGRTWTVRDNTESRRAQHLPEEGRDCSGTEEKGPLPGMFMEGFREEVAFTRLWDRKKREWDIPLSGSNWNKGRKEWRVCGPWNRQGIQQD